MTKAKRSPLQLIENARALRAAIKRGEMDFVIVLAGGGLYSSKQLMLTEDGRFAVYHGIDGHFEYLTGRELYTLTNIGKAMRSRAFAIDPR